jgi:endonuclease YncB( thermonuclease family)
MNSRLATLAAAACLIASAASAGDLTGTARVIDGDTIEIAGTHVRLWGIDSPEHDQTCQDKNGQIYQCGLAAATMLSELTVRQQIACTPVGHDRYGRTVGVCRTAIGLLNSAMVRSGWAIDYARYSGNRYQPEEQEARSNHLGLWAGTFELPEQWRQRHPRVVGQPTPLWNLWNR